MASLQEWFVSALAEWTTVRAFMHTAWAWPIAESLHFIGLALLVGTIGLFDLRLLGVAPRIPIGALHRLIPWGLTGFACNALTGALFVMAEPDQYVYNPSFHWKVLFITVAGLNAGMFYLTSYRHLTVPDALQKTPLLVKAIAVTSLCLWMGVIVAGRLLTFYRPGPCGPEGPGILARCIPGYPPDTFVAPPAPIDPINDQISR
jgi:hypothetical protein